MGITPRKILIEIPTKDREAILGKCLSALMLQIFQDFDVLILNDGDKPIENPLTLYFVECLRNGHEVWLEEGSHISQAHNHNIPLYDERFSGYDYYVRADDDVLMDRCCLFELVWAIEETGAGAVGGLWMEREVLPNIHDRKVFTQEEFDAEPAINGHVDALNSNWQQRVYHPTNELMEVEHVYSVAIVDMEKMRRAGGWPEVYSKGVAHCEETDGSYRLHLSGEKLYINPRATGQHLRAGGGIRSKKNLGQIQQMDLMRWQNRFPKLREINWEPTIAVECRHSYGLGGAERLFYDTVRLLQEEFGSHRVHPVFPCPNMDPDQVENAFGFRYNPAPARTPSEYDVLIVIGHDTRHTTQAKHKIFYNLFPVPEMDRADLQMFDQIVGISDYTCDWIEELWKYECRRIYPPVSMSSGSLTEKENIILLVSRAVPYKSPLWMMEQFVEMGMDKWELHAVLSTSVEDFNEYEIAVLNFAEEHDNIVVHRNISNNDLLGLYRRAKMLWGASGLRGDGPQSAEHFGYTPVEAWAHGCVPIMYDRGGHKETVYRPYRWSTPEDLVAITTRVASGMADSAPVDLKAFSPERYKRQWRELITRVNAMALKLEGIEQVHVEQRNIRVAMISDSPWLEKYGVGVTSGFGMVAGQVAQGYIDEPDIDLSVIGMYDPHMPKQEDRLPFDFFPPIGDLSGKQLVPAYLKWAQPDVIFMLHAPGELNAWAQQFRALGMEQPIVAYFPVEGAFRPNAAIQPLLEKVGFPVTYCNAGRELIRQLVPERDVEVAYHGIDHADFKPMGQKERAKLRKLVGLDDKFVVMSVGTNKRVKQHPVLIDAMRIILERGYEDIYMYIHTKVFDEYVLQGHHLRNILEMDSYMFGQPLNQHVLLPVIEDKWHSVPYDKSSVEPWRLVTPPDPKMRGLLFNQVDLISRYGMADLFVDVSSCEGFGLTPLEAIACGIPTISVNDHMVRAEVHSRYACAMLQPVYWDTWHTGTKLAMVSPEDVADAIIELYETPTDRDFILGKEQAVKHDLQWGPTVELFVELTRRAYALRGTT